MKWSITPVTLLGDLTETFRERFNPDFFNSLVTTDFFIAGSGLGLDTATNFGFETLITGATGAGAGLGGETSVFATLDLDPAFMAKFPVAA